MPPKKQQEEPATPIIVWNVLPVLFDSPLAQEALRKPVNLKKTLDHTKLIELLKEKGVEKYLQEGKLTREGELFACESLNQVASDYLAMLRKPADPKKDQKKDTKKDSKKQEPPPEEQEKVLELDFPRVATEFLLFPDVPQDPQTLQKAVTAGWKVDVVVWVQEKIKQGSRLPDYSLLNKERSIEDFLGQINSTAPKASSQSAHSASRKEKQNRKAIIRKLQDLRMKAGSELQNTILIQVPFLKDLQHPENDIVDFLTNLFKRLCELSLHRTEFENWKKQQSAHPMVPPLKEKIKRQVVIEAKQEKKGGKKDVAAQPQTEIIEQIIEKRYESLPGNAKSDLSTYHRIANKRQQKGSNIYLHLLENLAYSVSSQTQSPEALKPELDLKAISAEVIRKQKARPQGKIKVQNLLDRLRTIKHTSSSGCLSYSSKIESRPLSCKISLVDLLKQNPGDSSLQMEYKMQQFTTLAKQSQTQAHWNFDDRVFIEELSAAEINTQINLQLEYEPKIFSGKPELDNYHLVILARVNPPGRVLYRNHVFNWRVLPNFEFWENQWKAHSKSQGLLDYNWRECGNLQILSKRMMPTDNMIITESQIKSGDSKRCLVTLTKDDVDYGITPLQHSHLFWKHYQDLRFYAFLKEKEDNVELCVQKKEFSILVGEATTVFWAQHKLETKRVFTKRGEVIRYLKDGKIEILYLNGDVSTFSYGQWSHIRNNSRSHQGSVFPLSVTTRPEGEKIIKVREDDTVFVDYLSGDSLIFFKDGTTVKKWAKNKKIEIMSENGLVIRVRPPRSKDFNVIGAGSAFAYLGEKDLLERSHDGDIFQVYHPSFSVHTFTEMVDRGSEHVKQPVKLVMFSDGSVVKASKVGGAITFMHGAAKEPHERWLQLFTPAEYHQEGVYDVNLHEGWVKTRDGESNIFQVQVDGNSQVHIAVSFNIGDHQQSTNNYPHGFHVPSENYFLPPPHNCVLPRLFVINADGSGAEFLAEAQLGGLEKYRKVRADSGSRHFIQYSQEKVDPRSYTLHSFTEGIDIKHFQQPDVLVQVPRRTEFVPLKFPDLLFRSLEQVGWERNFSRVAEVTQSIQQRRDDLKRQLDLLKAK